MKKTTKILSGTLLVVLMSLGLATKVNTRNTNLEVRDVLTADMTKAATGRIVRRANEVATNKVSDVKAQLSAEVEGKRHIRFVAGLDSAAYADVKFDIVVKDGSNEVKSFADMSVTTAYTHVEAAGEVLSAADVFGADYNYLVAYTINNVPESAWGYTFEVTASVKTEEANSYTKSVVSKKVINTIASKDEEVVIPSDYYVTPNKVASTSLEFTISWKDDEYKVTKDLVKSDVKLSVGAPTLNSSILTENSIRFSVTTGAEASKKLTVTLHTEAKDYKVVININNRAFDGYTVEETICTHKEAGPTLGYDSLVIAAWGRFIEEDRFNALIEDFKAYLEANSIPYTNVIGNYYPGKTNGKDPYYLIANLTTKIVEDGGADIILPCATNFGTNQSNIKVVGDYVPVNVKGQSNRVVARTFIYDLSDTFITYLSTASAVAILTQ